MESSSSKKMAAIQELLKGKEFAGQLVGMVQENTEARGLVHKVLSSLSRVLDVLNVEEAKIIDQDQSSGLGCSDEGKGEVCSRKRSRSSTTVDKLRGGGCRKRRQGTQFRTVISKSMNDEHLWRKYGQKKIHSSNCPRSYYRCTNKYGQGCRAIKQVQKSEDDSSLYVITYIGDHSCKAPSNNDKNNVSNSLITNSNSVSEPSVISFGSNTNNITQEAPPLSSLLFSQRQLRDCDEEVLSKPNPYQGSVSDQADEISGLNSATHTLEMSFMVDSLEFGNDLLDYEEDVFFGDFDLL